MGRALSISVILAAMCMSACQYALPIRIEGDLQTPSVVMDRIGFFRTERPCITSVTVSAAASPNEHVWSVRHSALGCIQVDRITYGHPPDGFIELQAAQPLETGVVYEIWASAPGGHGIAQVSYVAGRWRRLK